MTSRSSRRFYVCLADATCLAACGAPTPRERRARAGLACDEAAFFSTAERGHAAALQLFLDAGMSLNIKKNGLGPLALAAGKGRATCSTGNPKPRARRPNRAEIKSRPSLSRPGTAGFRPRLREFPDPSIPHFQIWQNKWGGFGVGLNKNRKLAARRGGGPLRRKRK